MNAERDCFEPAMRSMAARTSPESVIEIFSFILLLYYHVFDRDSFRGGAKAVTGVCFLASHPSAKNAERMGHPDFLCDLNFGYE
jgi:hypothetical protein